MKSKDEIAKILKERRKQTGLSARKVTVLLNQNGCTVKHRSVYNWENGHGQPDANTFLQLCQIYKIADIMETFGYPKKEPPSVPLTLNTDMIQLLEKLKKLDSGGRRQVTFYMNEKSTMKNPDRMDADENKN